MSLNAHSSNAETLSQEAGSGPFQDRPVLPRYESEEAERLSAKIRDRSAVVCVVGLGYVGLPLALRAASVGFSVVGYDPNTTKVDLINRQKSCVHGFRDEDVAAVSSRFVGTSDIRVNALGLEPDIFVVCVPTPIKDGTTPDLKYVAAAARDVSSVFDKGCLVSLESTTYPGTTRDYFLPIAGERGLTAGKDGFFAYSPEREDPGNAMSLHQIPKVVAGSTQTCRSLAIEFYSSLVTSVLASETLEEAEMVKLHENTFRWINIAYVNQLKLACTAMGIDISRVCELAGTKPFGFMKFTPGHGVGGHCIPCDPWYLRSASVAAGVRMSMIDLAGDINHSMPSWTVSRVERMLGEKGRPLRGTRVHVFGVTYKPNIDDMRESPAVDVIRILRSRGADVTVVDPYVDEAVFRKIFADDREITCIRKPPSLMESALLLVPHRDFEAVDFIASTSGAVVDVTGRIKGAFQA